MSHLTEEMREALEFSPSTTARNFQTQRIETSGPAVGIPGFATMIRSRHFGEYALVAPTLDGLRLAFAQLGMVEPFDQSACTAITIVRTVETRSLPFGEPKP